jgi:hypothetical protein
MEEKYVKPSVKVVLAELRSAILEVSGGYNPPIDDDD